MAIIKCKMCGGDLNVEENSQIAVCEYCGTQQTVPKQDNEKKLTLFARANRLRFACEFDKAAGVYESIVAEFPEEAEAYWGLVLCKYGIEYVDDPSTGKKIPTCHRSSFDSVLEDANFELVMEYADGRFIARKPKPLKSCGAASSRFPAVKNHMIFSSATKRRMKTVSGHLILSWRRTYMMH